VRLRLSDFTRAGTLLLDVGEDKLRSAVIDPLRGFAYFGTDTAPAKVVRLDLRDRLHLYLPIVLKALPGQGANNLLP
jgi:hypothetical protein